MDPRMKIDKRTLINLSLLLSVIIIFIAVSIVGINNISSRFSKLRAATSFVEGASELQEQNQELMERYFTLQKIRDGLVQDSSSISYNSRVGQVLDKIKQYSLTLTEVEYGKQAISGKLKYMPVKFELAGDFAGLLQFIHYIENELQVMGFARLELKTSGASSSDITLTATINFYGLGS